MFPNGSHECPISIDSKTGRIYPSTTLPSHTRDRIHFVRQIDQRLQFVWSGSSSSSSSDKSSDVSSNSNSKGSGNINDGNNSSNSSNTSSCSSGGSSSNDIRCVTATLVCGIHYGGRMLEYAEPFCDLSLDIPNHPLQYWCQSDNNDNNDHNTNNTYDVTTDATVGNWMNDIVKIALHISDSLSKL